jgi:hypothetical protein
MRKNIYLILFSLLFLIGCGKNDEPVATIKNEIRVKVYNTTTGNLVANKIDSVVGATVNLISDSGTLSATTDAKGVATFRDVKEKTYYLSASKGDLSNPINISTTNNRTVGNLIIGLYGSLEDIANYAVNPNAVVGGVKLADVNGDGLINDNDKVQGIYVDFQYQYKDLNGDGVIDVKDISNGSLVQIDCQVGLVIFIGK